MNKMLKLVILFFAFNFVRCLEPVVEQTVFGPVKGKWQRTATGRLVGAFLGIPYAQPPIGPLRFKNPRPWQTPWRNTKIAKKDGSVCPQLNDKGNVIGNEDCLNLNIFVPYNETGNKAVQLMGKLPVLVYVHGGSYLIGSNNSTRISPEYLLDHDIILVSINYRLGFLGFLSTGNIVSPGNYGLKDAIVALKWVQENIPFFGGDPNSVTLQGHSAGAGLTHLLSLTNKTEGLFHKMIVQSGAAFASWSFHPRASIRNTTIEFAKRAGCSHKEPHLAKIKDDGESLALQLAKERVKNDMKTIDCLMEKDLKTLFDASNFFHVWKQSPGTLFGPTLEIDTEEAAITMHPKKTISEGLFRDIPAIFTVTSDEGVATTISILIKDGVAEEFTRNFRKVIPYVLEASEVVEDRESFANSIVKHYFHDEIGRNLIHNLTHLISDYFIFWPTYEPLQYYTQYSNNNIYFQYFTFEGTLSDIEQSSVPFHYGVSHGDDMIYQFPHYNYRVVVETNSENDRITINTITEMFYNFMKTGIPSSNGAPVWEPYQQHNKIMTFGNGRSPHVSMQDDFLVDRMGFWQELVSNVSAPLTEFVVRNEPLTQDTSQSSGICIYFNYYVIGTVLYFSKLQSVLA